MALAPRTRADFLADFHAWYAQDAVARELVQDGSVRESRVMGLSERERLQRWEDSTMPGTRSFSVHAAEGLDGVHFTNGLFYKVSFARADQGLEGAIHFLDTTAGTDGGVGQGAIGAALDEILSDVAWLSDCGGLTASLTVEAQHDPATGEKLRVPLGETLRYEGSLASSSTSAKGSAKSFVQGLILSADRAVVYARATGLFVRPGTFPQPSQLMALREEQGEDALEAMILARAAQEPGGLAAAEARREAALEKIRAAPGSPLLVTHLPDYDAERERWLEEDDFVAALNTDRSLGAPELLGKVFSVVPAPVNGSVTGAIKFAYCAQGPPLTAHGGSRFAVLERAALVACKDLCPHLSVRLRRCEVQMKARLPLDATVRLQLSVESFVAGDAGRALKIRGSLVSVDGQTLYDAVEADATAGRAQVELEMSSASSTMMPVAVSSKL